MARVLEIKINISRILYGLINKVFKPEKASNQIKLYYPIIPNMIFFKQGAFGVFHQKGVIPAYEKVKYITFQTDGGLISVPHSKFGA